MTQDGVVAGSFRDPSGVVFRHEGAIYRQVNDGSIEALSLLESSGLYDELCNRSMLVRHEPANVPPPEPSTARRVIRPEQIPFISYPYEWCFGQLKDAALLTLDIQRTALRHGMSLRDASAFNVQFLRGRPVLIDTLSFEPYVEGTPWVAYRQLCEHFLAPLFLIAGVDPWLGKLPALTADGVPLDTASRLLPRRSWLRPTALVHVHLHARSVRHFGGQAVPDRVRSRGMSRKSLESLIEGLHHSVSRLQWSPKGTEWADYESEHGYDDAAMLAKREAVSAALGDVRPSVVWDLGANTGEFSRLALAAGASVISMDFDPAVVELNYRRVREQGIENIHPLWIDLRNPSSDLGWAEEERDGLLRRADADCVLVLALIHHLAIGANVPLDRIMQWLARLAPGLVIEFVPKEDPQVQRLLVSREDVFSDYGRPGFETALRAQFDIEGVQKIAGSGRAVYWARRRGDAK